jgi:DNA-binding NarL/FixJ family response regulator
MTEVLIVDDNAAFRNMLRQILHSRFPSLTIGEAGDGNQAIKKLEKQAPDIIFMDVRLPGENGLSLTKRIKAAYPGIVIIIITSYDSPEYREAALEAGADSFVSKTDSNATDILERVETIISSD